MFKPKTLDESVLDETFDHLWEARDLLVVIDLWSRKKISEHELVERLTDLREEASYKANLKIYGPQRPDDPEAKQGTWDNSDYWTDGASNG